MQMQFIWVLYWPFIIVIIITRDPFHARSWGNTLSILFSILNKLFYTNIINPCQRTDTQIRNIICILPHMQ